MPRGRPRKHKPTEMAAYQQAERIAARAQACDELDQSFGEDVGTCDYCGTPDVRVQLIDHGVWNSFICKVCDRKYP
jgi:hypothetical protein